MDSTLPFSKKNVNIQSVKPNCCFWTNGKMGITFSSSLRSFCPTATRAIANGGLNTRNQQTNFSGISSPSTRSIKTIGDTRGCFSQPRKVFFSIERSLPSPRGVFLKRGRCGIHGDAVSATLPPLQPGNFYVTVLHRGLVQAGVYDICTQLRQNEEIQQGREAEGPPGDHRSHSELRGQARSGRVMPTLDWP